MLLPLRVEKKDGYTVLIRQDHKDSSKTNFYIKQARLLGRGGFKQVYPLLDYENPAERISSICLITPSSLGKRSVMRGSNLREYLRID